MTAGGAHGGLVYFCGVPQERGVLWAKCGPSEERAGMWSAWVLRLGLPRGQRDRPQQQKARSGHWVARVLGRNATSWSTDASSTARRRAGVGWPLVGASEEPTTLTRERVHVKH